jgi:ubiquitin-hydrolase Zn-finger-containing protein
MPPTTTVANSTSPRTGVRAQVEAGTVHRRRVQQRRQQQGEHDMRIECVDRNARHIRDDPCHRHQQERPRDGSGTAPATAAPPPPPPPARPARPARPAAIPLSHQPHMRRNLAVMSECPHVAELAHHEPTALSETCPECLAAGSHPVQWRMCQECGQVGCCDSSALRHATQHVKDTGHAVMRSLEPGESRRWCMSTVRSSDAWVRQPSAGFLDLDTADH